MKKLIYSGLFLAVVGIGIIGCKKTQLTPEEEQNNVIEYRLDNIPIIELKGSQIDLSKDGSDPDEDKLNQQLIDLADATKDLIKDRAFNALIVEIALESNVETVYYSEIKEQGRAYYDLINAKLAEKELSIESITALMTHAPILPNPEFPETGELEIYEPSIFVPNAAIANTSLQALISPNIETLHEEEDYIVAWFFDENGEELETILNEATAKESTNPLFILNHSIPRARMAEIGEYIGSISGGSAQAKMSDTYFQSTRIQIKNGYRYESGWGNRSEYCITGSIVRSGSPPSNFLHYTNNNDMSLKIKELTVSQISSSSVVNVTSHHAEDITPYSQNKVYFNTFERDWNRSIIDLGSGNDFGQVWVTYGRARYSNDWYTWIPSTLQIHATHFEWFGWETEIPFDNWKSFYNIVKVN